MKALYEEGRDVRDVISHIEMILEKSVTKIYTINALVAYDGAVKERANRIGIEAFAQVENADILRHLSYDGTISAQRLASQTKTKAASAKPKVAQSGCFAFNRPEGCSNSPCRYQHNCSTCGVQGHPSDKCQKVEPAK